MALKKRGEIKERRENLQRHESVRMIWQYALPRKWDATRL